MSGFDLNSIKKGACVKAPRIQIIGGEGFGKTSFAACYTNKGTTPTEDTKKTIIIPIKRETGADGLDVDTTPTVESYTQLLEQVEFFATEQHHYERLVIDSTSALEPLIEEHVCEIHRVDSLRKVKGFRVGESDRDNKWFDLLDRLDVLRERGIIVVFITHTKVKNFKDPERDSYDRWVPDIEDKVASIINKWCDMILFGSKEVVLRTEETGFGGNDRKRAAELNDTRWLYCKPSATRPGKVRPEFSKMPEKIELDHVAFTNAVNDAVSQ